ncbi:HNH endonuclease [Qipengyuania sp. 483]
MDLEQIRPREKRKVFDLVEEAGFDTTDWIDSFSKPTGYKANPKYCYEWSFVEPEKVAILNLWFRNMRFENGQILQRNNFREDARGNAGHSTWVKRALKLDETLKSIMRDGLIVRVVINDGEMRERGNPNAKASKVLARELDPELWTLTHYDWETGDNTLVRGLAPSRFADQFELEDPGSDANERIERGGSSFVRSREVRMAVLQRAKGHCELCGERGFQTHNGSVYLETHHVIPLCEGGADKTTNVVALCPNDHAKAHFGDNRSAMRQKLILVAKS